MGKEEEERKPRFLCLHGFRTSGEIHKKQIHKWPQSVLEKIDLIFVDAPFPSRGKSDVEGIFDPPYYEWFQFNKEFTEYTNFDECLAYIEDCMIKHGPIDGLLGFSQGAILSAALPGFQATGVALTKVPKIKFLIIIGGARLKAASLAEKAYLCPNRCSSIHFLGETDFLKPYGIELLESFVDPLVIHHPKGHTVPRLDDKSCPILLNFIERIQKEVTGKEEKELAKTVLENGSSYVKAENMYLRMLQWEVENLAQLKVELQVAATNPNQEDSITRAFEKIERFSVASVCKAVERLRWMN